MNLDDPRYRIRDFQARVMNAQLNDDPNMFELDREIETFALDMQEQDSEFDIMRFFAAVYESDGNMLPGSEPGRD